MPYPKLETAYRHFISNGLFLYQVSLSTPRIIPTPSFTALSCAFLAFYVRASRHQSGQKPIQATEVTDWTSKPIEREQALLSRPHHPQIPSVLRLNPAYSFNVTEQFYLNIIFRSSTRPAACNNALGVDGGVKVWPQISGGMVKNTVLREWARQHGLQGCMTTDV